MSRTLLFELGPRRPADGVVVPLRLCFKARGAADFLGVQWEPAVETPPSFGTAIGFDGRGFGASPSPQVGELVFALSDRTRAAAGLVWKDAAVTIRSAPWPIAGGNPASGDFAVIWTGRAEGCAVAQGLARVTLIDGGQALRVPVAPARFGSSGVALLDAADATRDRPAGTVVPLAWGRVLSIPGLLVDRLNGIWLFSGRPATSSEGFFDGGAAFAPGVARASLAALQANVPAPGEVDYCLDAGGLFLARPWDRPTYPFTAAATFGATRAADIAAAIVASRTVLPFKAGAVAAFNALQGAACGIYIDDDTTIAGALDRIFAGLGAFWKLTAAGAIDVRRLAWGTPAMVVPAHRRGAPERRAIVLPTGRRSIGFARNDKVHSEGEIAAIVLASDLAYNDGTLMEALKPAQAGADVTGLNTAADTARVAGVLAATLTADAATAKAGAASALSQISTIASDGVFDRTEKPAVKQQYDAIIAEQATIDARAVSFGITTAKSTYDAAIAALTSYLTGLSVTWFDPATDIAITRATFNGRFNDVYFARQLLLDTIAAVAATRATWVGVDGLGRPDDFADVTAAQPIVSNLSPTTGNALASFVASDGNPFARIVASGDARDGDAVVFVPSLPAVPQMIFFYGGNAAVAGQNISVRADGLSQSGFTMFAKSQGVTAGSTVVASGASPGGTGEPTLVIDRSSASGAFDGRYIYRIQVAVGEAAPGEPGTIELGLYARKSGSWVQVGTAYRSTSGTFDIAVTPGAVDFGSGAEFGVSRLARTGSGTALVSFIRVSYSTATVTETSLTPATASPIRWEARL